MRLGALEAFPGEVGSRGWPSVRVTPHPKRPNVGRAALAAAFAGGLPTWVCVCGEAAVA